MKNTGIKTVFKPCMILFGIFLFASSCQNKSQDIVWSLIWEDSLSNQTQICNLSSESRSIVRIDTQIHGIRFYIEQWHDSIQTCFLAKAKALHGENAKGFFSLQAKGSKDSEAWNYNGPVKSHEIFRQSPHDTNAWIVSTIPMQAVPMIAWKNGNEFQLAICNSPAFYENFTNQEFDLPRSVLSLNSGDKGLSPGMQPDRSERVQLDYNAENGQVFSPGKVLAYYPEINDTLEHRFEGLVRKVEASDLPELRRHINTSIAHRFSDHPIQSYLGCLGFASSYMNLRRNETEKSQYWVVPSVEYANTQYGRDAFWISSMLPPAYASECLNNELTRVNMFAEYPLLTIIWAYRSYKEGMNPDQDLVQSYVDAVESKSRNHFYYSFNPADGRLDFQYWGDVIAFEKDDVIAYNQGLFALALQMAKEMGLQICSSPQNAEDNYRELFNDSLGFLPLSRKKAILGPDPLVPDLLAQIYLGKSLLSREQVESHFRLLVEGSLTPYGFKIVANPDGSYLEASSYDLQGYISQVNREKMPDGQYFKGGSYYLYDNLFLLDACLHKIPDAYELLFRRIAIELSKGSTTFECLNTKTGEAWKPNMGWNCAIYAYWEQLVREKRLSGILLQRLDSIIHHPVKSMY